MRIDCTIGSYSILDILLKGAVFETERIAITHSNPDGNVETFHS